MSRFLDLVAALKRRPDIEPILLSHPNIPKPLHGLNPRGLLGEEWWNTARRAAYAKRGFHCWACGVHKSDALFHQWLEGHERYRIDYKKGVAEFVEVVALCHACHNFIHSGRLFMLFLSGKSTEAKTLSILHRGFSVQKAANLPPNPFALRVAAQLVQELDDPPPWLRVAEDLAKKTPIDIPEVAAWSDWRLLLNGKKYKPLWETFDAWREHYESD